MTRVVGYTRAVASDQDVAAEVTTLTDTGAAQVFTDDADADPRQRPGLAECLAALRPGDMLLVPSASHLSHSVTHFVTTVAGLRERGVGFRSLSEPALSTGERLDPVEVLAALEALRHRLVSVRTRAGMASAAAAGKRPGRPTVMTPDRVAMALELRNVGRPVTHIARVLGVSANSVQRALAPLPRSTDESG